MVGCYIFTAGIRSDHRKTGKPPEGNKGLKYLCTLSLTPSEVYYGVCGCLCVCVCARAQNHGCAIDSVTPQRS